MAETTFQNLSTDERRFALRVAGQESTHPPHLLEKDIWVVATLGVLFDTPFADHLTFKGGTSLSKVWRVINRFSEDVDVTFDIRAFAPDLVSDAGDEALPPTRSQEKRWTRAIRARLVEWVRDEACPIVAEGLSRAGFAAKVSGDGDRLYVTYEPMFEDTGFVHPNVIVEFGARSTGEPNVNRPVVCDAAAFLPELTFPQAHPTVMQAERTFWEKATAAHVFCRRERGRGERQSRHWHDLACLEEAGIAAKAISDRALALSVARHKAIFFVENDARGNRVDYEAAVSGALQLVPSGAALGLLADDYASMLAGGMLLGKHEPFDALMERCAALEAHANSVRPKDD